MNPSQVARDFLSLLKISAICRSSSTCSAQRHQAVPQRGCGQVTTQTWLSVIAQESFGTDKLPRHRRSLIFVVSVGFYSSFENTYPDHQQLYLSSHPNKNNRFSSCSFACYQCRWAAFGSCGAAEMLANLTNSWCKLFHLMPAVLQSSCQATW